MVFRFLGCFNEEKITSDFSTYTARDSGCVGTIFSWRKEMSANRRARLVVTFENIVLICIISKV